MEYPLNIGFKLVAISPQMRVTDATGNLVFHVKQKAFKLKEEIGVFADEAQTDKRYGMKADRVIDFSAEYHFTDADGNAVGSVKRQGMKSLWKAHFDINVLSTGAAISIKEKDPWVKVLDALLQQIPLIGMFAGYLFNPTYLVSRGEDDVLFTVKKQPAFFEGKFKIEKNADMDESEEECALLGVMMMLLLERSRG
jgi:uncharacterized protein YxjI